jgi:subtilisin-like proprotein convertase family protein
MMDWILRPALVAMVGLGQVLAPQTQPPLGPDQSVERIRVEAPVGPGSVYSTGDLATLLIDNATTDSLLSVSGAGAVIDISVRLRIGHPRLMDLDIHLMSPDGTVVKLANDVGGLNADFGAGNVTCGGLLTTFDDDATTSVLAGAAPYLGVYRPNGPLSAFHGRGALGTWTLRVTDDSAGSIGTLYCWELVMRRRSVVGDTLSNARSDVGYWRPSGASVISKQLEAPPGQTFTQTYVGGPVNPTDLLVLADYNGNGSPDPVWFTPSTGEWKGFGGLFPPIVWGGAGDVPVPGDYNADGTDDLAVWRPSTGTWYVRNQFSWTWGGAGDIPVPADYNGDGTTDMAVWRPSTGAWYVYGGTSVTWGGAGDIPVPADYDGDGRTDFGIWRPATGEWFILTAAGAVMPVHVWGGNGDIPVPSDYDDDLKAEVAVWRPSDGTYYIRNVGSLPFGQAGDVPTQKRPSYAGYPY